MADNVKAIKEYSRPTTCKQISSFLGLASDYRHFIMDFGNISRPLAKLRKVETFERTQEHENAFQQLKYALSEDILLAFPNFDREFLVTCDASNIVIRRVIEQFNNKEIPRPIAFASRALKGANKNYSVLDKEALTIKWLVEQTQ